MQHRHTLPTIFLILFLSISAFASDRNTTAPNRIEVIITVAGVQETVASIEKSSRQIAALTERLSEKKDFTNEDHELIAALTKALNSNAKAINNIADALPRQFENMQGGINSVLESAVVGG